MTPQDQSVPARIKFCFSGLHEMSLSEHRCKECRKIYERNYREAHKEKMRSRNRERYLSKTEGQVKQRKGSEGGKVTAIIFREMARAKYYSNPKLCKECSGIIHPKEGEKIPQVKKRKFCSQQCSSIFNARSQRKVRICKRCDSAFTRGEGHKSWRHCPVCSAKNISSYFDHTTKGELFQKSANWQSARSSIRKDADRKFTASGKSRACAVCGYSRYVEIAHRRPVKDFPESALISEINHIDNLCALCRNHHWEFDQGYLKFSAEWTGAVPVGSQIIPSRQCEPDLRFQISHG